MARKLIKLSLILGLCSISCGIFIREKEELTVGPADTCQERTCQQVAEQAKSLRKLAMLPDFVSQTLILLNGLMNDMDKELSRSASSMLKFVGPECGETYGVLQEVMKKQTTRIAKASPEISSGVGKLNEDSMLDKEEHAAGGGKQHHSDYENNKEKKFPSPSGFSQEEQDNIGSKDIQPHTIKSWEEVKSNSHPSYSQGKQLGTPTNSNQLPGHESQGGERSHVSLNQDDHGSILSQGYHGSSFSQGPLGSSSSKNYQGSSSSHEQHQGGSSSQGTLYGSSSGQGSHGSSSSQDSYGSSYSQGPHKINSSQASHGSSSSQGYLGSSSSKNYQGGGSNHEQHQGGSSSKDYHGSSSSNGYRGGSSSQGYHGSSSGRGQPKSTNCQCRGVSKGSPFWVPGLDNWCVQNCAQGYCPSTHCICHTQTNCG